MRDTTKFCPSCGSPNMLSARFCISCGYSFEAVVTTDTSAHKSISTQTTIDAPRSLTSVNLDVTFPPQKPKRLQTLSFLCLIDGVVSISFGLFLLSLICTAPLGVYGIIVGIFEITYALKIIPDPIKTDKEKINTIPLMQTAKPNKSLAIMQVTNILSLNVFSLIIGLLSLSWINEGAVRSYFNEINTIPSIPIQAETPDQTTIRNISDYELLSGIFWIILGTLQTLTIVGALAGIWNIFAGISHCKVSSRILRREKMIPATFEDITQLVIIGIINLIFGGFIGLIFVAFDFFIRDKVLKNRHLFDKA
ncbi:hypothetical protein [Chloroflexus sp.]|uniref:hypothetical protein n=1 Tax=Chloroflexus sp. TaxID=1904827 RepID=UPI004049C98A